MREVHAELAGHVHCMVHRMDQEGQKVQNVKVEMVAQVKAVGAVLVRDMGHGVGQAVDQEGQ